MLYDPDNTSALPDPLLHQVTTPADYDSTNGTVSDRWDYDNVCFNTEIGHSVLISYRIEFIWSLLSVTIGLAANSLNILVFTSKHMRKISSNVYLLNLAISDSLFLVTVTFAKILTAIRCLYFYEQSYDTRFDIYNTNQFMCKFLQYMLDMCSDYSATMILAFTVERFIACYYAMRFKELCTVRRAWIVCLSLLITICVSIIPYHMICMEVVEGHNVCTVSPDPIKMNIFFYAYIGEMLIYRFLPVIVIAILNVFIIIKIKNIHKQRQNRRQTVKHITNNGSLTPSCNKRNSTDGGGSKPRDNNQQKSVKMPKSSKEDKHVQLTIMLIIVSSTYIVLLMPNLIYFVLNKFIRMKAIHMDMVTELLFMNYSTMTFISAFAVNFFLYTMGGKIFRDHLIILLFRKSAKARQQKSINTNGKKRSTNGKSIDETEETLI